MGKLKIYYASIDDGQKDVSEHLFNNRDELVKWATNKLLKGGSPVVFVACIHSEIIVTENAMFISELLECKVTSVFPYFEDEQIHIHEYPSYEEAYSVALSMKEGESDIVFNSETKDSPYWNNATKEFINNL